jgi:hypothetical protein
MPFLRLQKILHPVRNRRSVNIADGHKKTMPTQSVMMCWQPVRDRIVELVARAVFTPATIGILDGDEPALACEFQQSYDRAAGVERTGVDHVP